MNILLINTLNNGGAAKACIRLHQGLLNERIDSKLLFQKKDLDGIPETYQILLPQKKKKRTLSQKLRRYFKYTDKSNKISNDREEFIKSRSSNLEIFSYPFSDIDLTSDKLYQSADIVNLHWVSNFLDFPSFYLKNTKPVVWTLHDANPFMGGEHYAERIIGIDETGCPIPRQYSERETKESEKIIAIKSKALKEVTNLHIVCPSHWLRKESERSQLFHKFPHYTIPYGFPTDIFKPLDRGFCREVLNIPKDKFVLLFVSESVSKFRKGFEFLKRSVANISTIYSDEFYFCAIGADNQLDSGHNYLKLGVISDERLMAIAYSAADIFVIPSLEDNLPNTMIESLLCGTPVVGFPTGGISETIINSFNGYICPEISVTSLQQTIEKIFLNKDSFDRQAIHKDAAGKYNLTRQANEYIALFESILGFHRQWIL